MKKLRILLAGGGFAGIVGGNNKGMRFNEGIFHIYLQRRQHTDQGDQQHTDHSGGQQPFCSSGQSDLAPEHPADGDKCQDNADN